MAVSTLHPCATINTPHERIAGGISGARTLQAITIDAEMKRLVPERNFANRPGTSVATGSKNASVPYQTRNTPTVVQFGNDVQLPTSVPGAQGLFSDIFGG